MKPEFETRLAALKILYQKLDPDKIPWILTGGTSLILQGVDVPANDIDILVKAADCKKISELLSEYAKHTPNAVSETEKYRSNYNKFEIDGVPVEVIGDFQYKLPDGRWSEIRDMGDYEILEFDGMKLRVLPLAEELKEYTAMKRNDKAEAISRRLDELKRG